MDKEELRQLLQDNITISASTDYYNDIVIKISFDHEVVDSCTISSGDIKSMVTPSNGWESSY